MWVWGDGSYGQLGLGDQANRLALTLVGAQVAFGGLPVLMVACGVFHSLVVNKNDTLWTFGSRYGGALSHNDCNTRLVPTHIKAQHFGNAKVVSVASGLSHSAAVTEEGTLYIWAQLRPLACQQGGKVDAHAYCPKPAAGCARQALPRSATNARPRLCYGHAI